MSDTTELVDLAVIFPDLEIELKYACADNITGKAIYQQARCLLHKDAITALAKSISIGPAVRHTTGDLRCVSPTTSTGDVVASLPRPAICC
ncbi:D-alanyl-D-alanine dipeptidase [Escherichia coli]|nr:D-alanyl-D-alanine dipeptidase [Escherichia coli]